MSYMSGYLEDFIDFVDSCSEQLHMSEADMQDTNLDLQDLQHFIEFGNADGKIMLKVYKKYKEVRNRRRIAKENIELCTPIVEWAEKNDRVLQDLRALLGQVRKTEKRQASRGYSIRGHILDDIVSDQVLFTKEENTK